MARKTRKEIFQALCDAMGRSEFKDLLRSALDWEGIGKVPADELVEEVASKRSIGIREFAELLNLQQLRAACEILAVPVSSRERAPFLDQLESLNSLEPVAQGKAAQAVLFDMPASPARAKEPAQPRTAKAAASTAETPLGSYQHKGETRKNNPTALLAGQAKIPKAERVKYAYDPHLPPVLRFDPTGSEDKLPELVQKATKGPLSAEEAQILADALRNREPWLEWAGKREAHQKGHFSVDPVALHIHERVSAEAIVRAAKREDVQRNLFADPELPLRDEIKFYQHDVAWANRLILGDSLQVMTSLSRREDLAGKVQMIYFDPPYGIRFGSNFQAQVGKRDGKEADNDLTREPEMVKAYRDTWMLGLHSYLGYIRDRVQSAAELLHESGSLFVQISEDNIHTIRNVLDEIFGSENFVSMISYATTSGIPGKSLSRSGDYLVWYAKSIKKMKYKQIYTNKAHGGEGAGEYRWILFPDGSSRSMQNEELSGESKWPPEGRPFRFGPLSSTGAPSSPTPFRFRERIYEPSKNNHWKTTIDGLKRLSRANYLLTRENSLAYYLFLDSYPVAPISNLWLDTKWGFDAGDKAYVVQTNQKVIERCMQMTTDPGDLVLDPTCGSGTTASVAESWGRRWITIDTSRVALSLARQRLMTNRYPWHKLRALTGDDVRRNPKGPWLKLEGQGEAKTLQCVTVPHITLKSIAHNQALDPIFERHDPILAEKLTALNASLKGVSADLRAKLRIKLSNKEKAGKKRDVTEADRRRWDLPVENWKEWEVPFDSDPDWPQEMQEALVNYRKAWRAKMDEVEASIRNPNHTDREELVDKPDPPNGMPGVLRVCGPFTVEGVRPEELSLGEDGLFDPTPNEWESREDSNTSAYFDSMIQNLGQDGVTFMGNKNRKLRDLTPLYRDNPGTMVHAEASWEDSGSDEPTVAIVFGPQYGPVTSEMLEEVLREVRRYKELIIAGFSFDAETTAIISEGLTKLTIHQAHIRPDLNAGMGELLKNTAGSQLFTVFGQPEISVNKGKEGYEVTLDGVDIYDPLTGTVQSEKGSKVAAWFLDSDFDGKCFCVSQAFFPDQDAWEKIIKALKGNADLEAFARFKGTTSVPFQAGKHRRIAVKVIDPRGNEVMAVQKLEA